MMSPFEEFCVGLLLAVALSYAMLVLSATVKGHGKGVSDNRLYMMRADLIDSLRMLLHIWFLLFRRTGGQFDWPTRCVMFQQAWVEAGSSPTPPSP